MMPEPDTTYAASLIDQDRWKPESSPFGLPKVRVFRLVAKKVKKKKEEATDETAAAAAPAAGAKEKKG